MTTALATPHPTPVRLACDLCDASLSVPETAGHPWRAAGREGWLVVPGQCLCPTHWPRRAARPGA